MKIAVIIVRTLMGLLFLFASVAYFLDLAPPPEDMDADLRTFNEGLDAAGYLMPLVKSIELLCALAFLSGRFVPLAVLALLPVSVNILLVHAFLAPEGLPVAVFVIAGNLFLIFACRKHYRNLPAARTRL